MRRAVQSGASNSAPPASRLASAGHPSQGDPGAGAAATIPGDRWFYEVQESLVRLIEDGGLTPSEDPDQVKDAVRALIASLSAPNALTQATADPRYRHLVLATDINLAAGSRVTQSLSSPFNDFRWIAVVAGESDSEYGLFYRVPRSDVTARVVVTGELFLGVEATANNRFQLYAVNPTTGVLTARGSQQTVTIGAGVGMASHDGDLLFGVEAANDQFQLYAVNPTTGVLTARGSQQTVLISGAVGMASHDGDLLFGVEAANDQFQLYAVNPTTGVLTARGSQQSVLISGSAGMASHDGDLLFGVEAANDQFQLYAVNPTTGVLTARGSQQTTATIGAGAGMASHGGDLLLGVEAANDQFQLYAVNPTTGVLTARGSQQSVSIGGAAGMASTSSVTGFIEAGNLSIDRNGASSIGLEASEALYIHEIIGIP